MLQHCTRHKLRMPAVLCHASAATSVHFLEQAFVLRASSQGAKVIALMLMSEADPSTSIALTICPYMQDAKPNTLILMKQSKNVLEKFFLGSVSRYSAGCAIMSEGSVIVVTP